MLTRETLASLSIDGVAHYEFRIGWCAVLEAVDGVANLIVDEDGVKFRHDRKTWAPFPSGWDYA